MPFADLSCRGAVILLYSRRFHLLIWHVVFCPHHYSTYIYGDRAAAVLKCEMIIASRTFLPTYTLQTDKYKVIRRRLLYLKLTIGLVVT